MRMRHLSSSISPSSAANISLLRFIPAKHAHSISSHDDSAPTTAKDLSFLLQGRVSRSRLLQLHARIFRLLAHQDNLVATRLIGHYPSNLAIKVFDCVRNPNIFPLNAIIRVLAEEGLYLKALLIFKVLMSRGISPNELTISFLLKACSREGVGEQCVKQVHAHVLKSGLGNDSFVCNGLLMVYDKAVRNLYCARRVFEEMPERSLVHCWTSLISGYSRLGLAEDALELFVKMLKENLLPARDTMVSVLSACSSLPAQHIQRWVNLLEQCADDLNSCSYANDYVNTLLVYLHGKCGKVSMSREAFDEISDNGKRIVLVWNTMISAYLRNGYALEALVVFKSMMGNSYCSPNHVTMVNVLSACAEVGDLDLGIWVHEYMRTSAYKGLLSSNVNLATSLIDMYSKCGNLDAAREVFDKMREKDVVSFNAMITGLAINGKGHEALRLFSEMQRLHLSPDSGSFLAALHACSHSGLLEQGREVFHQMIPISPRLEHYSCFVDLLSRSGFVEEALGVVASMPFKPNNYIWSAILSGCVLHNRLEMSESISTMLVSVDPENSAGYVMLSNSLAADCQWSNVLEQRGTMRDKGVSKQPGRSWIDVEGVLHEFVAGSVSPSKFRIAGVNQFRIAGVDQMIESLTKEMQLLSNP